MNENQDANFVSFETVTIDNWDIKLSHYGDQILVCMHNRDTGLTDIRFFTNQYKAYYWIDYVCQIQ